MKIRTDFVTNSSSANFTIVNIINPEFASIIKKLDSGKESHYYSGETACPLITAVSSISEWQLLMMICEEGNDWVCYEDYDEYYAGCKSNILSALSKAGKISLKEDEDVCLWYLNNGKKELETMLMPFDREINAEIDQAFFGDGDWGPFSYVRAVNGRRLIISIDWFDDDNNVYRNEGMEGKCFTLGKGEYANRDTIVKFINEHGGSISDSITERTTYYVTPELKIDPDADKARKRCIPVLSEDAFSCRWLGKELDDYIYRIAYRVGFDDLTVRDLFEIYGVGSVEVQIYTDEGWKTV